MRRLGPPLTFLAFAISVYLGLHVYLWVRLIAQPALPGFAKLLLTVALVLLGAIPLIFGIFSRMVGLSAPRPLERLGLFWLGSYFLLALAVGFADLLGRGILLLAPDTPLAVLGSAGGIAKLGALLGFSTIGAALWGGLRPPPVREVRLEGPDLPAALRGLTIVQLSDVHIGPTLKGEFLAKIVARVNALRPDLVAITGDLVDQSVAEAGPMLLPLRDIRARLGVVYVPGNHEYYHGGPDWFRHLRELGVRVLRNEGLVLGQGAAAFYVAGVDDPTSRRADGAGADLPAALRGRPAGMAILLLVHQPLHVAEAVAAGVSLQLSGHTHGGQLLPFRLLVRLRYRFVAGLYRVGRSYIYVSCGTGFWGPPMRLGTSSEITRLSFEG